MLIRPGGIGDCIVSFPALQFLSSTQYTEVWVPEVVLPLVRFGQRVRSIASTGLDLVGIGDAYGRKALEALDSFDEIYSWYGSGRDEFRGATQKLPIRFFDALPPDTCRVSATDFFCGQVGAPIGSVPAIPGLTQERGPFLAIHPLSGSPKKNWNLNNFRTIAEQIDWPVRWFAGPEEDLSGAERIENLLDLALQLAGARAYLGNDSGITHLAAACGVPTVAVFRQSDPAIWAPRGQNVSVVRGDEADSFNAVLNRLRQL